MYVEDLNEDDCAESLDRWNSVGGPSSLKLSFRSDGPLRLLLLLKELLRVLIGGARGVSCAMIS